MCVRACARARIRVRGVCCSWISCFLLRSLSTSSMRYIHRSLFLTASRVTRQRARGAGWGGREGDLCELTCLSAYVAAFPNTRRGIRESTNRFIIARLLARARRTRGALDPRSNGFLRSLRTRGIYFVLYSQIYFRWNFFFFAPGNI